jgi:hypothetical protein
MGVESEGLGSEGENQEDPSGLYPKSGGGLDRVFQTRFLFANPAKLLARACNVRLSICMGQRGISHMDHKRRGKDWAG